MVALDEIRDYSRRIAREFKPSRIVLFGSYASGRPTVDSDVDLMVILDHRGRAVDKAVEIRLKVKAAFPLDLLVWTPEKVRERIEMEDPFMKEIMEKGLVLYEADDH